MHRFVVLVGLLLAAPAAALEQVEPAERSCRVVDLRDTKGDVRFALDGTALLGSAFGEANLNVELKRSEVPLRVKVNGLVSTLHFGQEYLTYVAWHVDAGGATRPLGELRNVGGEAALEVKVPRGPFGIIVTAEPHFAVTRPSDTVVLSGRPTVKAAKRLAASEVTCALLPRGHYAMGRTQESMQLLFASDAKTPAEMLQARNAIDIARLSGAETFAGDRLEEATRQLIQANNLLLAKGERRQAAASAAEAVRSAELARQIAVDRQRDDAARLADLEQARREAAQATALLEDERRDKAIEAQRLAELERRLADEQARREQAEQRREQELLNRLAMREQAAAPPIAPTTESATRQQLSAELARIEQDRETTRGQIEELREELRRERESRVEESAERMKNELELERLRLAAAMAEERAELEVERARLDAERRLLEERQAAPSSAPTPEAEPAPQPTPAVVETATTAAPVAVPAEPAASEELSEARAEWSSLSEDLAAERDALAVERAELRVLREELQRQLEAARQAQAVEAAEPAEEVVGVEQPATQKRRWWFGKKKAADAPPSTAELDQEWQRLEAERERLAEERAALESQRGEIEAAGLEQEPAKPKRRWWFFGGKKSGTQAEPVAVEDPALAAELSRIEAEHSQREAELEAGRQKLDVEREKLDAERTRLEAEMKLREAQRVREAPVTPQMVERTDPRVSELSLRVEQLERELAEASRRADDDSASRQQQAELAAELSRLRGELESLKTVQQAPPAAQPEPAELPTPPSAQPAPLAREVRVEERLMTLLNADRTVRGLVVRLPDLSFASGRHELRPEAREQLARLAGVLSGEHGVRVEIEGHTDSTGDPAVNQRLSELRAAAVLNYLAELGVPGTAMTARGFGAALPAAPNDTAAGRRQNRRVELIVNATSNEPEAAPGQPS